MVFIFQVPSANGIATLIYKNKCNKELKPLEIKTFTVFAVKVFVKDIGVSM